MSNKSGKTENKYDMRIFSNGRVVFYKQEDLENALKLNKEIAIICLGWSGGDGMAIGADIEPNYWADEDDPEFGKDCYNMYSYSFRNANWWEYNEEELKKFYKIIITKGEKIYMQSGGEATTYMANQFYDTETELGRILNSCFLPDVETEEDLAPYRRKVDEESTICSLDGTYEERRMKCQLLIDYRIVSENAMQYVK